MYESGNHFGRPLSRSFPVFFPFPVFFVCTFDPTELTVYAVPTSSSADDIPEVPNTPSAFETPNYVFFLSFPSYEVVVRQRRYL